MKAPKRGEIYLIDLNPVKGSEQGKTRPCLIVQNNLGNKYSPTTIILPITTKIPKKKYPTDIFIPKEVSNLNHNSVALANQIRTVDKSRLIKKLGKIPIRIVQQVNYAIMVSLALETSFDFE